MKTLPEIFAILFAVEQKHTNSAAGFGIFSITEEQRVLASFKQAQSIKEFYSNLRQYFLKNNDVVLSVDSLAYQLSSALMDCPPQTNPSHS